MKAIQEMWVRSSSREDPLKKERATHSNIIAWEIPWTEEPGGLQSMGLQRVVHDLVTQHMSSIYKEKWWNQTSERHLYIEQLTVPFPHTVEYFKIILRIMLEKYPHMCICGQEKAQVQISYSRKVLFFFKYICTHTKHSNFCPFIIHTYFFQPKVY